MHHIDLQQVVISQSAISQWIYQKLAASMRVYNIAETEEWTLAPAEWTRLKGAIGVNGNTVLALASADQKSNLSLYAVPACVGCGLDAATPFSQKLQGKIINYMVLSLVGQHHLYT